MAEWQNPEIFAIWLAVVIIVISLLAASIVLFTRYYFKRIIDEQKKLSDANLNHQKELLEASVYVQERERNRIAADLHDELVSKLNVILLSQYSNADSESINMMLNEAITKARNISHDLSPPLLEETDLPELISEFLEPLKIYLYPV